MSQNSTSAAVVNGGLRVNPYPANSFCPENVCCLFRLLHIFKCTPVNFYMVVNIINSDQTAPKEQSDQGS